MKRAQRTDLLREMKKSFNRYISILAIMALGVAFYAGVRSSEPDMQLSVKKYFDETNYMDIWVLGTLGMTEDDVKEIGAMYGVELAEGGYQTELFLEAGQRDYQMSVYSIGDEINQVYVTEGRVPEAADECFMDRDFMESYGYKIGDVITFRTEADTELADILSGDTFTIVGSGIFPTYLTWQRGAVSIGTGTEDGFVFLPKDAFSMEAFTVVYATVEGAKDLNPYSEEYENYIDEIVKRIENIADARCEIRYEEVVEPYWEDIYEAEAEIADGEQEIKDGEQELSDAEQKLADAEAELSDAEAEIADAEKKIADGEKEIADGKQELSDAEAELLDGEQKLADAKEELIDALNEIEDGERQLEDAEQELSDALAEIEDGERQLADAEKELADALAEIEDGERQLADAEKELADALAEIEDGERQLADAEKELADALAEIEDGERQLADGEKELADAGQQLSAAEAEMRAAEAQLAAKEQELAEGEAALAAAKEQLAAGRNELAAGKAVLSQKEAELNAAKELLEANGLPLTQELLAAEAQLNAAKVLLAEKEAELLAGEQQLAASEAVILAGKEQLAMAKEQLLAGRAELDGAKRQYADGWAELETAKQKLADGRKQYEDGLTEFEQAKLDLEDGRKQYEDGLAEFEQAKLDLEDGRKQYEDGLAEFEQAKLDLEDGRKQYEDGLAEFEQAKLDLADGKKQYEDGLAEYEDAKLELEDGRKKYEDGLAELEQAENDLEDGRTELEDAKKKVADAKDEIADAKIEIEDGKKELEDGKQELADGKKELEDAKEELSDLEVPEWYVLDRGTVQQLVEYGSNTERVGNLGDVFPAVFYLVAALVSLTTMTRMIEEERIQIGTMKALGYGKGSIVSKYLWYSLSATLLGGVFGVTVGSLFFPWVIMSAYGILYSNIPYILTPIQWDLSVISVMIAVVCTVVATMSSCYKEMVAAPAILMRPVAPPAGRRVFLEYIKPLWNALSFSWKATCRNLFRYKKRFFMTVFGIGGCMALLLVGFGLRDSIMDIVNKQFKEIWTYDAYLSVNDAAVSLEGKEHEDDVENRMLIQTKTLDVESPETVVSATLFVPERLEDLEDFVKLKDRVSQEKYVLTENNIILTEKLAKLLDVSVGDTIELHFDDVTRYPVTIAAISENYMSHYVYISAEYYYSLCGEEPEYNQLYLKTRALTEAEKEAFSGEMLSDEVVDSVTYVEELQEDVAIMMQSMELVIVVLIVAAGMLAFIVLYNLNNINIIERRRELATLKVLGFYDLEVANYVYRENVLLTVLGTMAGVVMGVFLHRFVIMTVEVDMMMFGRDIEWPSYIYSVLLTFVFAVLINLSMFYKLRKIDMVESLKSAE